jgi:hypothetical protein
VLDFFIDAKEDSKDQHKAKVFLKIKQKPSPVIEIRRYINFNEQLSVNK